jgi:hypothetical protein
MMFVIGRSQGSGGVQRLTRLAQLPGRCDVLMCLICRLLGGRDVG